MLELIKVVKYEDEEIISLMEKENLKSHDELFDYLLERHHIIYTVTHGDYVEKVDEYLASKEPLKEDS